MSNTNIGSSQPTARELNEWTINELVAAYPETMSILAPLGIDLCCEGLHPLGEALDLHGYDRVGVIEQVEALINAPAGSER